MLAVKRDQQWPLTAWLAMIILRFLHRLPSWLWRRETRSGAIILLFGQVLTLMGTQLRRPTAGAPHRRQGRYRALMVRVGFIGVGRMGLPMCGNLVRAGYQVTAGDVRAELESVVLGAIMMALSGSAHGRVRGDRAGFVLAALIACAVLCPERRSSREAPQRLASVSGGPRATGR